tara:strand:- start:156 stop:515 length:360 start_codon:yes stop_codon:yes gene_type:complete
MTSIKDKIKFFNNIKNNNENTNTTSTKSLSVNENSVKNKVSHWNNVKTKTETVCAFGRHTTIPKLSENPIEETHIKPTPVIQKNTHIITKDTTKILETIEENNNNEDDSNILWINNILN